jgi:hypothetical protein
MRRLRIVAAAVIVIIVNAIGGVALAAQCSMCRSMLASPDAERLAGALRSGISILLAAPASVFGIVALAAVRSRQRLESERNRYGNT